MHDALEKFRGFGVSCLVSLPHGESYRITLGLALLLLSQREGGASHFNITWIPQQRIGSVLVWHFGREREDHHSRRGGGKVIPT